MTRNEKRHAGADVGSNENHDEPLPKAKQNSGRQCERRPREPEDGRKRVNKNEQREGRFLLRDPVDDSKQLVLHPLISQFPEFGSKRCLP